MKKLSILSILALSVGTAFAQGISADMLSRMEQNNRLTPADRAIRNALAGNSIKSIAENQDNKGDMDTYFNVSVPSKGITNQLQSGRCWLFTGLNILRSRMINKQKLEGMELSQVYVFFYDQLEKSNLFLQAVIDTRKKPLDDQTVTWLMQNPLSDGGTFTGVADLVTKYGVVPNTVMRETYASNNTNAGSALLKRKLREYALVLRESKVSEKELLALKERQLSEVYHMLTLLYGEPVKEFKWAPKNAEGDYVSEPKTYTPLSFYREVVGEDLLTDFVMVMNDPTREYWKTYEIQYDRHTYDGRNWLYLNLPLEDIKEAAIASLKDSTMMYFSCDVAKELDSKRGLLDLKNYDYESILGVKFGMDKRHRIQSYDSGSSHAMTMKAVHLDANGKPLRWEVENSWGAEYGHKGFLIMTDEWFDEYMFRLVINKKYLSEKILKAAEQKPVLLPCWDPMFMCEE